MKISLAKNQVQKQAFSAQMEKSIALLILPHADLTLQIEQEVQDNPLLEAQWTQQALEVFNTPMPRSGIQLARPETENEPADQASMEQMMSLEDHLFLQLFWERSDPLKQEIGKYIISNLNKDGFLSMSCAEIAQALGKANSVQVEEVLKSIQDFDPPGIAAKDFKDCLLIQLSKCQSFHRDLAMRIVEHHLELLGQKRYAALGKKLSASLEDIKEAEFLISTLEPRPARGYRSVDPTIYIAPDLYIRQNEQGEFYVETNANGLPALRINATYRRLLNQSGISEHDRQFIKEKITRALLFIKNIIQRGETLLAIGRIILKHQRTFFEGDGESLAPLSLKAVAEELERNESTVSRAISHKYIDTPQGIFPLKFFFSHEACRQNQNSVSAYDIKKELAKLIEEEDPRAPLSDQQIQKYFLGKGLPLSRRTITKYRRALDLPASYLRK